MTATPPEITVVLPTDSYETARRVIAHLRSQSARDRLELVLVTPSREHFVLPAAACEGLHSVRVVESDLDLLPRARAVGIRAANAPVVVLAETHAYPDPDYAQALIDAHRESWAVVGPAMLNANPDSMLAWAALFLDYGPWVDAKQTGPMVDVPAHNGAYKRAVLLEYGPKLEEMLDSDPVLNADLRSRGYRLYLEARARTYHLNVSKIQACGIERIVAGRAFAASRAKAWPTVRRAGYALGSPLIPVVRLLRTVGYVRTSGLAGQLLPELLPALMFALLASAFGELLGYAFGAGNARRLMYEIELHRERYVRTEGVK